MNASEEKPLKDAEPSMEEAMESLAVIKDATEQVRKAIASTYTSPILILWGLMWVIQFTLSYFYLVWVYQIFMYFNVIGIVGTIWICRRGTAKALIKIPASKKMGWRIFWFWALLFAYSFVWLNIMSPYSGLQMNAFLCTAVMFAYIIMGLWFAGYYMVWLGLAITCTTLIGFYLIPHSFYCLWMALMAGGVMLITGLYIRFRWK
jgi:hypothetical protein